MGCEIGFEDLGAVFGGDARAVVANFEERFLGVPFAGDDTDFTARFDRLDGIVQQIEQRLAEQLFIRLDHQLFVHDLQSNVFLVDIVIQCAHDFADDGPQRQRGAPHFARAGVVDEFVELGRNPVGLLEDFPRTAAHFWRRVVLLGDHLRQSADNVQRIARFVSQPRRRQIHLLQMRVQFTGADQAHLQFGGLDQVAPGEPEPDDGDAGKAADDPTQPEVLRAGLQERFRGHDDGQTVQPSLFDEVFVILLAHPGRAAKSRPAGRAFTRAAAFGPVGWHRIVAHRIRRTGDCVRRVG